VFAGGGYYFWDAGYWFPALGYDPLYDSYDYDGPIYTYGDLLPDQVIINVQRALQQLGYYSGGLTGSIGPTTRAAIASYQQDAGLTVTGAIDAPTVEALGLY
jgi:peptidoglycan hydrolase-like protein with peptidoglycan-binding domain